MDKLMLEKYQPVIGLEVHAQLLTNSKIYNSDSAAFGGEPNTHVGVVSLAHPGTLPKLNKRVVEQAIKMGLACHCEISRHQIFDRKNYFYPDLPKGYQLTQDRTPICKGGFIKVNTKAERDIKVVLNRIHIEEDAGKSIHLEGEEDTLIDLNRAGVALIEIVTEPVMKSAEEAGAFFSEVRKLVRYLEICDGNMEEGSLRCDANISVMKKGTTVLGKKVEVKNMNSIRNLQHAIDHEIERQILLLENGGEVKSETRTFNVETSTTSAMRTKEELNDYRYFPDPDLSPLEISEEWLSEIKATMPELPEQLYQRFVNEYSLPEYDAQVLTETKEMADYYLAVCEFSSNYKAVSNWIMGPVKSYLNDTGDSIDSFPLIPEKLSELIEMVEKGNLSFANAAQKLLPALLKKVDEDVLNLATRLNLIQDNDEGAIDKMVEEVLNDFPAKVKEYKKGKKGLISMFMGEVMKKSRGKADPKMASSLLQQKLNEI
ncbi:MAG TPA: Asp-tRNA(Asn)/Glu-tRNA(Gln) amidotransferase subunit GatB [Cyclobacteriaceae bacterium]|nr:Asp-tRNA(Asn)/Glu-tRNA(Gln) amidotransferase subunit GatB [Cyclobacteriaceae bacterium]HRK54234.1 Asp-tRNA(Asn)/Glu-tRNA(Gln) amidotransferase subunit GatB [Cyclobacteriaceae bacterium]